MGKIFGINKDSFAQSKGNSEKLIQGMERMIIENGGRVIDNFEKAMFIIQEDGFNPNIWKEEQEELEESGG